jgi:hypothetical protein
MHAHDDAQELLNLSNASAINAEHIVHHASNISIIR